jgi:hypothetical protein
MDVDKPEKVSKGKRPAPIRKSGGVSHVYSSDSFDDVSVNSGEEKEDVLPATKKRKANASGPEADRPDSPLPKVVLPDDVARVCTNV